VEVVLPSLALWMRSATDSFFPELINHSQAGRLIGQMWDLDSELLCNRLVFPAGMVRVRRGAAVAPRVSRKRARRTV